MADSKLSALTALAVEPDATDQLYVNDGGVSKRIAYSVLEAAICDTTNVTAAGALMDSEVTNLAAVKAFDPADYATAAQGTTADSALQDVVSDTTPQLGGSLDVNGNKIVSASNGNIDIEPNGTGNVLLGNFTFDADQTVGAGQDNYVLTYDNGTGLISLEAAAGGGSGDFLANGTVDMTGEFRTDVGTFDSDVADGASANAYTFNTANTYSTAGANLLRLQNNGTNVFDFSFQGGIGHVNSGANAGHSQSLNLNWSTTAAAQTSSGQYSCVIGERNTASSSHAVAVGFANTASGGGSFAAGQGCTASSGNAIAVGLNCTASGAAAFAAGSGNTAAASGSAAFGAGCNITGNYSAGFGAEAATSNRVTIALGADDALTAGDVQSSWTSLYAATTDATQTTLLADGTNLVIPADASWCFSVLVIGRSNEADGNDSGAYRIEGCIARDESNNTALVGSITKTVLAESAGAAAWDATIEADDTNEALAVKVTGEAGTNIRWVAKVDIAQVIYA